MTDVNMVPIEFVLQKMENEEPVQIVEALSAEEYNKGHLPGAVYIPQKQVAERAPELLKKDVPTIVYCAGYTCHASTIVARKLTEMGYTPVYDFKGGKPLWRDTGLELKQKIATTEE